MFSVEFWLLHLLSHTYFRSLVILHSFCDNRPHMMILQWKIKRLNDFLNLQILTYLLKKKERKKEQKKERKKKERKKKPYYKSVLTANTLSLAPLTANVTDALNMLRKSSFSDPSPTFSRWDVSSFMPSSRRDQFLEYTLATYEQVGKWCILTSYSTLRTDMMS